MTVDRQAEIQRRRREALQKRKQDAESVSYDHSLAGNQLNLTRQKNEKVGSWIRGAVVNLFMLLTLLGWLYTGGLIISGAVDGPSTVDRAIALGIGTTVVALAYIFAALWGAKKSIEDRLDKLIEQFND